MNVLVWLFQQLQRDHLDASIIEELLLAISVSLDVVHSIFSRYMVLIPAVAQSDLETRHLFCPSAPPPSPRPRALGGSRRNKSNSTAGGQLRPDLYNFDGNGRGSGRSGPSSGAQRSRRSSSVDLAEGNDRAPARPHQRDER